MEAGTGIEPVFTDLQSRPFSSRVKGLGFEAYQDKTGTGREPDTDARELSEPYRGRLKAATALCHAIAECEPEDAAPILEAALLSISAGWPDPPLQGFMDQAAFWADLAPPAELKAYALTCFRRLSASDQAAFLAHVTGSGHG